MSVPSVSNNSSGDQEVLLLYYTVVFWFIVLLYGANAVLESKPHCLPDL